MIGQYVEWWIADGGGYRRHPARPGCSTPARCAALSRERLARWGCLCVQAQREAELLSRA